MKRLLFLIGIVACYTISYAQSSKISGIPVLAQFSDQLKLIRSSDRLKPDTNLEAYAWLAEMEAINFYTKGDYKSASDCYTSAIISIRTEIEKMDFPEYLAPLSNLLKFTHNRIWCNVYAAATERLTDMNIERIKAMVYADSDYLLSDNSGIHFVMLTKEDVYLARGLAKYFLGVQNYYLDLNLAGKKGKEALNQIR